MSDNRCLIPGCVDPSDPDGRPRIAPKLGGLLCGRHYGRLAHTLDDLPTICDWLEACVDTTQVGEDDRVSGTKAPPIPIRPDVVDLLDDIAAVLASWCRLVVEEHVPVLRGPRSNHIGVTSPWLRGILGWVETQPWVDECYAEIVELRRRAHTLAPWQRHARHLPTPCPVCDERTLVLYGGTGAVTCTSCHELIPEQRYGLWERYVAWLHGASA